MDSKLNRLRLLNKTLEPPQEIGGLFLPIGLPERFEFMFVAEMPAMGVPKKKQGKRIINFNATARDRFLQEMMIKYGVEGSYVTDIVKKRDRPRRPTPKEIQKWLPFLLKEIEIIKPGAIIVLGRRTYEASFRPYVEPRLRDKDIKVDHVFHYSNQVPRKKFERRFGKIISRIRNSG
ncbi:MAG: uracil-DNA glycosylase family protein [bacterium]|nr:uracil-DNA glycosylase family protein [bacterium]